MNNWTILEWISSITVRDGKEMVCRCTQNAKGKKYAHMIAAAPEMYEVLMRVLDWDKKFPPGPCPMSGFHEFNSILSDIEIITAKARGER